MNFTTDNFNPQNFNVPEFNPIDILIQRKNLEKSGENFVIQHNPQDMQELEDFCKKHGVLGFSCGNMSPKAALALLKGKLGIADDVIKSYESMGYTAVNKSQQKTKEILKG